LQALVGADVTLVENGEAVARQTRRLLRAVDGEIELTPSVEGHVCLFSTGDAHILRSAAAHWLGVHAMVHVPVI
jgi:glutamate racemase